MKPLYTLDEQSVLFGLAPRVELSGLCFVSELFNGKNGNIYRQPRAQREILQPRNTGKEREEE